MQGVSAKEDQQNGQVVIAQDAGEDEEVDQREEDVHRVSHEEGLDAGMVSDALHDVARHLRVEVVQGQFHEFHQEVGNKRDVDARIDVQHDPAPQESDGELREEQRQLGDEYEGDEPQVAVSDTHVDHGLRKEWEHHLQEASQRHAEQQLCELLSVWKQISGKEQQVAPGGMFRLLLHVLKIGTWREQ